ncbi:hypothetical protein BKP54_33545 [Ensifer sp. 1H6]|nr:hypothetical protein BKP54_33545 [Ensifer sp. 1H6]
MKFKRQHFTAGNIGVTGSILVKAIIGISAIKPKARRGEIGQAQGPLCLSDHRHGATFVMIEMAACGVSNKLATLNEASHHPQPSGSRQRGKLPTRVRFPY